MTAVGADERLDELCVNTIRTQDRVDALLYKHFGSTPERVAESGRAAVRRARENGGH